MAITVIKDIKLYEAQRDGSKPYDTSANVDKLYPYQDVLDIKFSKTLISFLKSDTRFDCIVAEYPVLQKTAWAFKTHQARVTFQNFIDTRRTDLVEENA